MAFVVIRFALEAKRLTRLMITLRIRHSAELRMDKEGIKEAIRRYMYDDRIWQTHFSFNKQQTRDLLDVPEMPDYKTALSVGARLVWLLLLVSHVVIVCCRQGVPQILLVVLHRM